MEFNTNLTIQHGSGHYIIAFDPSYIRKSGKKTPGLGRYWSGCAQASKWGLEIGGIAAVDVDNNFAFHLDAIQTPSSKGALDNEKSLLDWYGDTLYQRKDTLSKISTYLVADAYFSKRPFLEKVRSMQMHLISRLRDDADLKYLYYGPRTGKRGRPKKHDGKIDWNNLKDDYFERVQVDDTTTIHSAVVFSKSFKCNIKISCVFILNDKGKETRKIYFSSDLEMLSTDILEYYRSRFQIEFVYRDGKQFTGLEHCQARSENKLNFHFNASLTSVNLARISHWLSIPKDQRPAFSMADVKTLYHNTILIERFIDVFAINPNTRKNQKIVK
ncbi:MAG: transposase, partial [Clostridia bacterium]|nr:transposase [Clostridia bacterium]